MKLRRQAAPPPTDPDPVARLAVLSEELDRISDELRRAVQTLPRVLPALRKDDRA